jgi:hypothetical protein
MSKNWPAAQAVSIVYFNENCSKNGGIIINGHIL